MITVFDLDGVLSRSDTMATLVFARLRARPWLIVPVAALAIVAALARADSTLRPRVNRAIVAVVLHGVGEQRYRQLVQRVAVRLARRRGNASASVMRELRAALGDGDCVVSTATEHALAVRYLEEIGLTGVTVHASTFTFGAQGPRFAWHNVGSNKVESFRRAHPDERIGTFYTDSATDLPLARRSARTVLVGASRRSIREFRRAGVPVEVWRGAHLQGS
ncbi:MAG: HAD family hydrolase [Candidatus Microbacterium colombiense]|nr:MAG: HAD family hydrolase [Microbacterium sp.]